MLLNLTNVAVYVPEIVASWTNLGGTTQAFDGNVGSVYNAKADWDAQATMPLQHVGKPVRSLTYFYANDAINYGKKVRFLDLYYWDGAKWVFHRTFNSSVPYVGGPTSETHELAEYMPNPTGRIRVIGRGMWDQYGYRWVSEIRVTV